MPRSGARVVVLRLKEWRPVAVSVTQVGARRCAAGFGLLSSAARPAARRNRALQFGLCSLSGELMRASKASRRSAPPSCSKAEPCC